MPLFNRVVSLRVGKGGREQLLEISNLRIIFKVNKNSETTANTAVISIYNLSNDTRNKLNKVYDTVILKAGYADGDGPKLLFSGNISQSYTKRQGSNLVTTINCGDGLKALVETKFNRGYSAGTSSWDILDDILKSFNLPEKITNRLKNIARKKGNKFANAFSAAGSAKEAMNKIIASLDLEWSIQNGAIKIIEPGDVDDSPIVYLTSGTGLIGLPVRLYNLKRRKNVNGGEDVQLSGWQLEALLFPEIEPGGRVRVEEERSGIGGEFRVEEIEQRGDNFGNNWNSFITVSDL